MGPFSSGWTEADVEAVIARGDPEELLYVPIVIGMNADDCDRDWVERILIDLSSHPHFNVRSNAILGFGHTARTYRTLSLDKVLPIISGALTDPHQDVRDQANDTANDLLIYLGVVVPGYDVRHTEAFFDAVAAFKRQHHLE
ncbi:hypothetical protein [Leeia sp.]|uniref:hypothetical protein n=1 Tax=Leeia sp. TaxID=2884678 RepID=UPI0035B24469